MSAGGTVPPLSLARAVALSDDGAALPADFLVDARYAREVHDLVLSDPAGGARLRIVDYFDRPLPPPLADAAGRQLSAHVVERLAGPRAPGQVAQNQLDQSADDGALGAPIGSVTETTGTVTIARADGSTVQAEAGLRVYQDDRIETPPGGAIGLSFNDGSSFSLGGDARVVLDELIYQPGSDSSMVLNLVKGSFSFVSGQIAKTGDENMAVVTPVATIGVRGTAGAGTVNEVVLLPEDGPDGQPILGEISFRTQAGETILNQPNQRTFANSPFDPPSLPETLSDTDIQTRFGESLGYLPGDIPASRGAREQRNNDGASGEGDGASGDGGGDDDGGDAQDGADDGAEGGEDGDGQDGDTEAAAEEGADGEEGEENAEDEEDAVDPDADPDADIEDGDQQDGAADDDAAADDADDAGDDGQDGTGGETDEDGAFLEDRDDTQLAQFEDGEGAGEGDDDEEAAESDPEGEGEDSDSADLLDEIDFGEDTGPVEQPGQQAGTQTTPGQETGATKKPTSVAGKQGGDVAGGDQEVAGGGIDTTGGSGLSKSSGGGSSSVGGGSQSIGGTGPGTTGGTLSQTGTGLDQEEDGLLLDEDRTDGPLTDGTDESAGGTTIVETAITFTGGGGSDRVTGGSLPDVIDGGGGNDVLLGGGGNDRLTGGAGNDVVAGGSGSDTLVGGSGEGDDIYVGGDMVEANGIVSGLGTDDSAEDEIIFTSATQGITVNLGDGSAVFSLPGASTSALAAQLGGGLTVNQFGGAYGAQTGTDLIYGVENIESGVGNDHLTGDSKANRIIAGAGNDIIAGWDGKSGTGPGADRIQAGAGNDQVTYFAGYAGNSAVTLDGGTGNDTLKLATAMSVGLNTLNAAADGFETVSLASGGGTLSVGAGDVAAFLGAAGTLTVTGGTGTVSLTGAWSATGTATDAAGLSYRLFSDGGSVIRVQSALSVPGQPLVATGGATAESFTGTALADRIDGRGGDDLIDGGLGADTLEGGAGDDVVIGGGGADTLIAGEGAGDDIYVGGAASRSGMTITALGADTESDTAIYTSATQGVTVNLGDGAAVFGLNGADSARLQARLGGSLSLSQAGGAYGAQTGTDALFGVENIQSGVGADDLTGSSAANRIVSGAGNDRIAGWDGYSGNGPGSDVIDAGAGDDRVTWFSGYAGDSAVTLTGGQGTDTLMLASYTGANLSDIAARASGFEVIGLQDSDSSLTVDAASLASFAGTGTLTVTGDDGYVHFNGSGWNVVESGTDAAGTVYQLIRNGNATIRLEGGVDASGINLPPVVLEGQGLALSFDTAGEAATGQFGALDHTTDFTIELSFAWDGTHTGEDQLLFYVGLPGPVQPQIQGEGEFPPMMANGFGLKLIDDGANGYKLAGVVNGTTHLESAITVTADTLHHVALVNDDGTFRLVVDGTDQSVTNQNSFVNTPSTFLSVGGMPTTSDQSFFGQIDDVRVWSMARGTADIAGDRATLLTGEEGALVHYFRFDEDGSFRDVVTGGPLSSQGADHVASDAPLATIKLSEDPSGGVALSLAGVDDPDGSPSDELSVTLSLPNGYFFMEDAGESGVGFESVTGIETDTLVLTGTRAALNHTLRNGFVHFSPAPDFSGTATLTVTADDNDPGGAATDSATFTLRIEPVLDDIQSSLKQTYMRGPGEVLDLSGVFTTADTDGSETLSVTITGVPEGGSFNAGTEIYPGTIVVSGADLGTLAFTAPADSLDPVALSFIVNAAEGDETATAFYSTTLSLELTDTTFDYGAEGEGNLLFLADSWSEGTVPGTGNAVTIDTEGFFTLSTGESLALGSLDVLGGAGIEVAGGSLSTAFGMTFGDTYGGHGELNVTGGTLDTGNVGADLYGEFLWTGGTISGGTISIVNDGYYTGGYATLDGTMTLDGAALVLDGGSDHEIAEDTRLLGGGTLTNGGTLAIAQNVTIAPTLIQQEGAEATFTADGAHGYLALTGGAENAGTFVIAGAQAGTLSLGGGERFVNEAGGVVRIAGTYSNDQFSLRGLFDNRGTVLIDSDAIFETGTGITLTTLDTSEGGVTVSSGNALEFGAGTTLSLGSDSMLDGGGTLRWTGGQAVVRVDSDYSWTSTSLDMEVDAAAVTFTGSGTFRNQGDLTLGVADDVFDVAFVNDAQGTLELRAPGSVTDATLSIREGLTNAGALTLAGGSAATGNQALTLSIADGAALVNQEGATFTIAHGDQTGDTARILGDVVNHGVIEIADGVRVTGDVTNNGTIGVASDAELTIDGATGGNIAGSGTILGSGTLSFVNGATLSTLGTLDLLTGGLTVRGIDAALSALSLDITDVETIETLTVDTLDLTGSETLTLDFENASEAAGTYRIVNYDGHDSETDGSFETVSTNLDDALYDVSLVYGANGIDAVVRAKPRISGAGSVLGDEDAAIAITGLSILDADAGGTDVLTLDLQVSNGTLHLSDGAESGVTIMQNDGAQVRVTGTLAQINGFLGGAGAVTYRGDVNFHGTDSIDLSVTDADGLTGSGSIGVTVASVDDVGLVDLSYLAFDGVDDHLDVGDVDAADITGALTIEVRANLTTAPGAGDLATLASKWGGYGEHSYWFGIDGDTGKLRLVLSGDGGEDETVFLSDHVVEAGVWAQYSVVVDPQAESVTFHVNGGQVGAAQPWTGSIHSCDGDFVIGANDDGAGGRQHHFEGGIAEVRLWADAHDPAGDHGGLLQGDESGLAGYWRLDAVDDGLVPDRTDNGNDAAAAHGPPVERTAANALLDGGDDWIDIPVGAAAATGTGDFTWEGWVRTSGREGAILSIGDAQGGAAGTLYVDGDGMLAFAPGYDAPSTVGGDAVDDGAWHHVAVRYEGSSGGTLQLFVDGAASGDPGEYGLDISGDMAAIGRLVDGGMSFEGAIADFRVWNDARTDAEIDFHKDGRLTGEEDGLAGYWPLDEGNGAIAADRSGEGNHGTARGGVGWANGGTSPPVVPGEASVALDGNGDHIDLGSDAALFPGGTSFTLESWVRIDAGAVAGGHAQIFSIGTMTAEGRIDLRVVQGTGTVTFTTYGYSANANSAVSVADGQWHHVAAVYDATTQQARIYIDGEASGAPVDWSAHQPNITAGTAVMGRNTGGDNPFVGQYSEARIWNDARTAGEIADNYLDRLSGAEDGLVGYWPFNEEGGSSAANSVPGGTDATLQGDAWFQGPDSESPVVTGSGGPSVDPAGTVVIDEDQTLRGRMSAGDVEGTPTFALTGADGVDGGTATKALDHGTVTLDIATGEWTYSPNADATGSDSFTVTVAGATSGSDSQTYAVTLDPVADAPRIAAVGGNALDIDAGEAISVPHDAALDPGTGSFTVEAWVDFDEISGTSDIDTIVGKISGAAGWVIQAEGDALVVRVSAGPTENAAQSYDISGLSGWHHLALVVDRTTGTVRGYLDGSNAGWSDGGAGAVDNDISGFGAIGSTARLGIGGRFDEQGTIESESALEGQIDEVRLWSTARSESDLQDYSTLRLGAGEDGLVAIYGFEWPDAPGYDLTGNGHDGVSHGDPDPVESGAPVTGYTLAEDSVDISLHGLSIVDPDGDGGELTVVIAVERGRLDLDAGIASGILAAEVVGNGTGKLIVTASAEAIARTLATGGGLIYTADPGASGIDRLQVTVNDGTAITRKSFDIAIAAEDEGVRVTGGALQFDGIDDVAEAAELGDVSSSGDGFTIEGWVNSAASGGGSLFALTGADGTLTIGLDEAGYLMAMQDLGDGGNVESQVNVADGLWHHVAVSFEGGSVRFHVDGRLMSTVDDFMPSVGEGARLILGENGFGGGSFEGMMDEVRLWDGARTDAQIGASHDRQLVGDEAGLRAYYRFDEQLLDEVSDSSGNGHDLRLGGIGGSDEAAPDLINDLGGALSFDGTGSVTVAEDPALDVASFTIETWFRSTTDDRAGSARMVLKPDISNEVPQYSLVLDNGVPRFVVHGGTDGVEQRVLSHSGPLDDGQWHHVAGTYDAGTGELVFYVDGQRVDAGELEGNLTDASDGLIFGQAVGGGENFTGELAEIRLWDDARGPAEVLDGYNLPAQGDESGLVGLWRGVEGPDRAGVVTDGTGGHDGMISGGVDFTDVLPPLQSAADGTAHAIALEGRTVGGIATADDVGGAVSFAITSGGGTITTSADGLFQTQALAAGTLRLDTRTGEWVFDAAYDVSGPVGFEITASGDDGRTDVQPVTVMIRDMTFEPQVNGGVLSFDSTDLVTMGRGPDDDLAITGDLTVEMWINPSDLSGGRLLSFGADNGETSADNVLYSLHVSESGTLTFISDTGQRDAQVATFDAVDLTQGAWQHVSVVRDNGAGELRLYLNGQIAQTLDYAVTPTGGGAGQLVLGADTGGEGGGFSGLMDEIRVWSGVRDADAIRAGYTHTIDDPGGEGALKGYWRADDGKGAILRDSSASGSDGAIAGAEFLGGLGKALYFDGTDDIAVGDSSATTRTSDYTIETWFKWDGVDRSEDQAIVFNGSYSNGVGIVLDRQSGTVNEIVAVVGDESVNGQFVVQSGTTVEAGRWYHVALVNEGGVFRLYVDGAKAGPDSDAMQTGGAVDGFTIGGALRDQNGELTQEKHFGGEVASVAVWEDARTPAQIIADRRGDIDPGDGDLAAYYRAEDMAGDATLADRAGGQSLAVTDARVVDAMPEVTGSAMDVTAGLNAHGWFETHEIEGTASYTLAGGALNAQGAIQADRVGRGSLIIDPDSGAWTFIPADGFVGELTFTMQATGSISGVDTESVTFTVRQAAEDQVLPNVAGAQIAFDGDDVVTVGMDESLRVTDDLTIELWLNPSDLPEAGEEAVLLGHAGDGEASGDNILYSLGLDSAGDIVYRQEGAQSGAVAITFSDVDLTAGTWAHIALVRDGAEKTVSLYRDGVLVGGPSGYGYAPTGGGTGTLRIGGAAPGDDGGFKGMMDDIRLFDEKRSAADIDAYHDRAIDPDSAGLLANWRGALGGDGHLVDATGNGHDGILGGPLGAGGDMPRVVDPPDRALRFDGSDDSLAIADSPDLSSGDFTLEAWFRTDVDTGRIRILTKPRSETFNASYSLRLEDGRAVFNVPVSEDPDGGSVFSEDSYADGQWHHIAGTYEATTGRVTLYVDGAVQGVVTREGAVLGSSEDLHIGSYDGASQYFDGEIADVRLWTEARDAESIHDSMSGRLVGDEQGLAGYWPLDDGTAGATPTGFTDRSANGNDAAAASAPTIVDTGPPIGGDLMTSAVNATATGIWDAAQSVVGTVTYGLQGGTVGDGVASLSTAHGTAYIATATGAWWFVPDAGFTGTDGFTLTATGAESGSVTQDMTVEVTDRVRDPLVGGAALMFDGGTDAVLAQDVSGLGGSALTIELWVNPAEIEEVAQQLVSYATSGEADGFGLGFDEAGTPRFFLNFNGGDDAESYVAAEGVSLPPGQWSHLAVSWDGATGATSFYVNGVKVAEGSYQFGETLEASGTLALGQDAADGGIEEGARFKGALDEVRIWSEVRSETEIAAGFDHQVNPGEAALAVYYTADGLRGGVLTDLSPQGNDGTLDGASFATLPTAVARFEAEDASNFIEIDVGGSASALDLTDRLTIEGWIKPNGHSEAARTIFAKAGAYSLVLDGNGDLVFTGHAGGFSGSVDSDKSLAADRWQHVAAVFENGVVRLYIDGELDRTATLRDGQSNPIESLSVTTDNAAIGGIAEGDGTASALFLGDMGEIRVWSVAQDANGIHARYQQAIATPDAETDLAGYWRLDDMADGVADDLAGDLDGLAHGGIGPAEGGAPLHGLSIRLVEDMVHSGLFDAAGVPGQPVFTVDGGSVSGEYHVASLTEGTIRIHQQTGHWTFTPAANFAGTAADLFTLRATGDGGAVRSATISASVTAAPELSVGASGASLRFDGDDIVRVEDAATLDIAAGQDFTAEMWVYYSGDGAGTFIEKWDAGETGAGFRGLIDESGRVAFEMSDGAGTVRVTETAALGKNAWHHIAFTADRDGLGTIHIDGEAGESAAIHSLSGAAFADSDLLFGDSALASMNGFEGGLDEIRFWKTLRAAGEIAADRDTQLSGTEAGLEGYWRFDDVGGDGVADSTSVNAHDGIVGEAAAVPFALPDLGRAATFSGTSGGQLTGGDILDVGGGNLSVSAWVRFDDTGSAQTILSKGDRNATGGGWAIKLDDDGNLTVEVGSTLTYSMTRSIDVAGLNGWHHVGFTYGRDGNDLELAAYLDGHGGGWAEDETGVFSIIDLLGGNYSFSNLREFTIGARDNGLDYDQHFTGAVDEVQIHDVILGPGGMRDAMAGPIANPQGDSDLVAYYRFDEQSGVALDSSASGNDLVGAVTRTNAAPEIEGYALSVAGGNTIGGVLDGGDTGGNASPFSVGDEAENGTVEVDAETGAWSYRPDGQFTGEDSFSFQVTDASGTVTERKISVQVTEGIGPV
nr:LamG-like jellyroll fold domain-containing protein [Marivibrio halodurans]